jgi:DNA primase
MRQRNNNAMRRGRTDRIDNYSRDYQLSHRTEEIDPEEFYNAEVEQFQSGQGEWAIGCCPFHPDSNPSFAMNMESGGYYCHSTACGVRGGDIVSFVRSLYDLNYTSAIAWLESEGWM